MVGKWHLGHRQKKWLPARQGFTFFEGCHNGAVDYFTQKRNGERDWQQMGDPSSHEGYTTDLIGEASVRFISSVPKTEPFFLYLSFRAPHSPFQAKAKDLAKYPKREGKQQAYAAMVDCMDQNIGRVINILEERDQLDDTFILFFSDNGGVRQVANNAPHKGGKLTVYQGGINVVAAAHWPKGNVSGGKIIRERMGYIDVFPTLMEVVGYQGPLENELDGVNVLNGLRGRKLPNRHWFTYLDQNREKMERFALNTDQWKLVWERNAPDNDTQFNQVRLFSMMDDQAESDDRAEKNKDTVKKLQAEIEVMYDLKIENQNLRYFEKERLSGPVLPNWIPVK